MNSVIGFSIWRHISDQNQKSARAAQDLALAHFKHLERSKLSIGASTVEIWGHQNLAERTHRLADGSLLILIGSPLGDSAWQKLEESIRAQDSSTRFIPPWDGRFILFHVSADGEQWTMWNDWLGSIPVFHASISDGEIASTLEPVVVKAAGFTSSDFFFPGLLSLFINGHFFSDWTFYKKMKTVPPDCRASWLGNDYQFERLWTIKPSQDRWETGWDELVDEMHELSSRAILDVLNQHDRWILPLSSGLDSRLIAGVGAKAGKEMQAYAWGEEESTDVVYSREVARILSLPWKHIKLRQDYLLEYTKHWASWFGSGMYFHGMYVMNFLDALDADPESPVISGFVGDTLAGDVTAELVKVHAQPRYHLGDEWHVFWSASALKNLMKFPVEDALEAVIDEILRQVRLIPGARFQQLQFLELWGRQRMFISYQASLCDYWRGVGTPFINRAYARFSLSLPRPVLDDRRLLSDVFRRYYGPIAVIPGTYSNDPFILTGRYLLKRRLSEMLPWVPLKGFVDVPLRLDYGSMRTSGRAALWPLFERQSLLNQWLDFNQVEENYQIALNSNEDNRYLSRLQVAQTLAYRLLDDDSIG